MFANLLSWDDGDRGTVDEPLSDETQVRERIAALDGHARTLVIVSGGEAYLAVGGDRRSGLVVSATFDNEVFHTLVFDTPGPAGKTTVVAGGQPGRYDSRNVVPAEMAFTAASVFAREGRLADELTWSQD